MLHPNGNEHNVPAGVNYWRARAEELEKHLAATRLLLMQVTALLPAEHLDKLQLNLIQAPAAQLDHHQASSNPQSA